MLVRFHTNLDEARQYLGQCSYWTQPMPPRVGEEITFHIRPNCMFTLQVVAVRWNGNVANVELHLPNSWGNRSIAEWTDWMNQRTRGED